MLSSKGNIPFWKLLNSVFILTGLVLVTSCSVDSPTDRPEELNASGSGNGSFYVTSIRNNGMTTKMDKSSGFPSERVYNIEVCLRDFGSNKYVKNHRFSIENGEKKKQVTTNLNGCFTYNDEIKFNYLTYESSYIHLQRTIRGVGTQRGFQKINYALNPWRRSKAGQQFYNLSKGEIAPKLISGEEIKKVLMGEGQKKALLWIDRVDNFRLSSGLLKGTGYESELELFISPKIKFLDINGHNVYEPLKEGEFIVKPYVISKNAVDEDNLIHKAADFIGIDVYKNRRVISIEDTKKANRGIRLRDGVLKSLKLLQIPVLPTSGELEVGLEVYPAASMKSLRDKVRPFNGIYHISQYKSFVGSKRGSLSVESHGDDFDLKSYVDDLDAKFVKGLFSGYQKQKDKIFAAEKSGEEIKDKSLFLPYKAESGWVVNRYQVKVNRPKFLSYGKISLPTLDVNYNASVCISDPYNGGKIMNRKFFIHTSKRKENGERFIIPRETKSDGCFSWPDTLTFKAYDKEHYHIQDFIVESKELGFKEAHAVAINPWDFGFTFGFALEDRKDVLEGQDLEKKPASTVFIPDFTYRNLGFDYKIDKHLNLILRKHMIIRIHPDYMGYHSITRLKPIWPLFPGKYLMKLVVMRNFYEDPFHAGEYISHVTKFVEVFRGRIITDVTFEIDNIRLMGSRNLLMIEIFPVYENKLMVDPDSGKIVTKNPEWRLDTLDKDADDYTEQLARIEEAWDKNIVAHDSGLVSKPYIGPILILNETGGAPALPGDVKSRLNSMSKYNLDKLLAALEPGTNDNFADIMKALPEADRDELAKVFEKGNQIPEVKNVDGDVVSAINNRSNGDNYMTESALSDYRDNTTIVGSVKKYSSDEFQVVDGVQMVTDEQGNLIPASHPRAAGRSGQRVMTGAAIKNAQTSKLIHFGEHKADGPEAAFRDSGYVEGIQRLKKLLNIGQKHYDEKGSKINKMVVRPTDQDFEDKGLEDDWRDELIPIEYKDKRTGGHTRLGYAPPRHDITTTAMIKRGKKIVASKKEQAEENSKIEHFLNQNSLELLNLSDEDQADHFLFRLANPLWHMKDQPDFDPYMLGMFNRHSFDLDKAKRIRMGELRAEPKERFSKDELDEFIHTGVMSGKFAEKLCEYWFYDLARQMGKDKRMFSVRKHQLPSYINERDHEIQPLGHWYAAETCKGNAARYWNVFAIERKIIVHKLKDFQHQKGLSVNMSVNAGVRWGFGQTKSVSHGFKQFDLGTGLDKLIPMSIPFNIGMGYSVNMSRSKSYTNGIDEGSGNSVNLVVQRNEFQLTFDKYEHCVSIKLNPLGFNMNADDKIFMRKGGVRVYWNEDLSREEKGNFLNKGFFICTGEQVEEEKTVDENYYYITQHFNVGHSFDMPSIKNRWFDIALRGDQTLTLFSSLLNSELYTSAKTRAIKTPIGRINEPLFRLLPIYAKLPTSFYKIYSLDVDPRTFAGFQWSLGGLKE